MAVKLIPKKGAIHTKQKFELGTAEEVRYKQTVENQKKIYEFYKQLLRQTEKKLQNIKKDGAGSAMEKLVLYDAKKSIEISLNKFGRELETGMINSITEVSKSVVDDARKFLLKIGYKYDDIKDALYYVPDNVVKSLLEGTVYKGDWSLSSGIWTDIKNQQDDILKIVTEGLKTGKSAYDIAKVLESYVDPDAAKEWDWSKVYPNMRKKVDYNAQRLARTIINHAFQQSVIQSTKDNPFVTGIQWLSAYAHGRTCQLCISRATEDNYGLGAGIFPKDKVPLDHPNGLCALAPYVPDDLETIAKKIGDWYNSPPGTYPYLDKYAETFTDKPLL